MTSRALLVEDNLGDVELFKNVFDDLETGLSLDVAFDNGKLPNVLGDLSISEPDRLPRIIFLNINLPGLSGLEILQRIRNHQGNRFMPVVVLTSSGNPKTLKMHINLVPADTSLNRWAMTFS